MVMALCLDKSRRIDLRFAFLLYPWRRRGNFKTK